MAAPQDGDVILLALSAPYEQDNAAFGIFHGGSLAFPEDVVDKVTAYSLTAPTVVVVYLERPAVLTPLTDAASVLVGQFGASDRVLCEALTTNRFDSVDPLFSHGAGGPTS